MRRFTNILVVYNNALGADDALTQAESLAQTNGARLTLVDVCPLGQRTESYVQERRKRLARIAGAIHGNNIAAVAYKVLVGNDHEEIMRQVHTGGHDMVIAGSEGDGGGGALRKALLGTLASSLMRNCPCPVWIVKPDQRRATKVLAAVDLEPNAATLDPTSIKVIEMASSLARSRSADLHVMHAWEVAGNDAVTLASEVPDATRAKILSTHEDNRRSALSALISAHANGVDAPTIHMPRGSFLGEMPGVINSQKIDLVVMGCARRSGLTALLLGDAAASILKDAGCGVLTVRPDVYAAPLQVREGLEAA